jgi:GNAT superfamily N-acetyltransferase
MNVTKAGVDDLDDLLLLTAEYQKEDEDTGVVDDARNAQYLTALLGDRDGVLFIGRTSSGQPIGFVSVYRSPNTLRAARLPQMMDLFVREPYRRQGFGRQLFQHAVRWAKSHKHPTLAWFIGNMNMPAQYLFDSVEGAVQSGWVGYRLELEKERSHGETR